MDEAWSTWLSYRPGDFLMFAPRTYWRLFELVNTALWPAPLLGWGAGVAVLWAAARSTAGARPRWAGRAALVVLALAWAGSGRLFLWERFAPIYGVAGLWAWLFGAAALLLLALSWSLAPAPGSSPWVPETNRLRTRAAGWLGFAALLMPLLPLVAGRPWMQAELFGLAPDPTVLLTLAVLLLLRVQATWACWAQRGLLLLCSLWCLHSAATLAIMQAWEAVVPALGALVALGAVGARWLAPRVGAG